MTIYGHCGPWALGTDMSDSKAFYKNILYPLQDKVLTLVAEANSAFYLTGGTALSRGYLHHRFSDDLDFFVNNYKDFKTEVDAIGSLLAQAFPSFTFLLKEDTFVRAAIREEAQLKIDFVNYVDFRVGAPLDSPLFVRTDNHLNILANKVSALSRDEPKDFSDIWFLAKNSLSLGRK
ncbi:MAG: nucleotidyl transferase AbiEii/AbiGii toxin family protein [Cytophagales bacterium]|nr:nucleotidyl transferase AbiEii/AbiGii toxin family protein [Cytophagales bacterium]